MLAWDKVLECCYRLSPKRKDGNVNYGVDCALYLSVCGKIVCHPFKSVK